MLMTAIKKNRPTLMFNMLWILVLSLEHLSAAGSNISCCLTFKCYLTFQNDTLPYLHPSTVTKAKNRDGNNSLIKLLSDTNVQIQTETPAKFQ